MFHHVVQQMEIAEIVRCRKPELARTGTEQRRSALRQHSHAIESCAWADAVLGGAEFDGQDRKRSGVKANGVLTPSSLLCCAGQQTP